MNDVGKRWTIGFAILLFAFVLFSFPVLAQTPTQLTLSPMVLEMAGERGATVPFSVSISNSSRFQAARFLVWAEGLRENRSGDYAAFMPDDGPYAASDWIQFERDSFEVPPGSSYELRGTISIPRNAPPSGYAAIVVELQPEERVGDAALSMEFRQQFVVAVEMAIGRRHIRSAHVDSMTVIPASSQPQLAATYGRGAVLFVGSVVNDGDVHIVGTGRLIIRDERGRRVREVPLGGGRGVVLPDAIVDYVSVLGGLEPGKYEMQAIIDYSGSRPAIGRMEFELGEDAVGLSQAVAGRAVRVDASPSQLVYEFTRQGYRAQTITVVNRDKVDVDFTVSMEELLNDADGQPVGVEPDVVMPYSAVEWGDVRPAAFTLRPGQRRNVVVGFRTPDDVTGGRYARIHIEGRMPDPEPGLEVASTELIVDSLLMLGTDFAAKIDVKEPEWRLVADTGRVSVGAVVVNSGDIHGAAGMRFNLLQLVPETEEEVGDVIVVTSESWNIVDGVQVDAQDVVLLPGEERFMYGIFGHIFEPERQYQVMIEALGDGGERHTSTVLNLWMDADRELHEGFMPEPIGDEQ